MIIINRVNKASFTLLIERREEYCIFRTIRGEKKRIRLHINYIYIDGNSPFDLLKKYNLLLALIFLQKSMYKDAKNQSVLGKIVKNQNEHHQIGYQDQFCRAIHKQNK